MFVLQLSLFVVMIICSGCGQSLPPDLPTLYSVSINITQENKPLPDAVVFMINEDPSSKWTAGGITNQNGIVNLRTNGQFKGVPLGTYKVTVRKTESPDAALLNEISESEQPQEYARLKKQIEDNTFELVEEQFSDFQTSPLSVEITPDKSTFKIDVGKSVRRK
ncbi:MAG: carboxypeptidase-like regulatory domain-containing protein [Planctomycetaceae bacterium]|nr:carboxypeptidase-like regulatory domain-containing protein [Planctomycetaceae bacterium]